MKTAIGLKVKLDRDIDRAKPCHDNLAVIHAGKAQHAGELRCAACGAHRGWLATSTRDFIHETVRRLGAPSDPITVRQTRKETVVSFEHKPNRGSLFKNTDKQNDDDRDYTGSALIGGEQMWVSAWVKEGKSGRKFLSLSFKPKNDVAATGNKKPVAEDVGDSIPF